jgi:hypothetical protein
VRHRATRRFWQTYHALPQPARAIADKNFKLLKADPRHPSRTLLDNHKPPDRVLPSML